MDFKAVFDAALRDRVLENTEPPSAFSLVGRRTSFAVFDSAAARHLLFKWTAEIARENILNPLLCGVLAGDFSDAIQASHRCVQIIQ